MWRAIQRALGNLFRKPATVVYPQENLRLFPGYRGLIKYEPGACTSCERCGQQCPAESIVWGRSESGDLMYHYNPYLCIYCGECVRACPKKKDGALYQSEELAAPGEQGENVLHHWDEIVAEARESQERWKQKKEEQRKARKKASLEVQEEE